MGLLNPTLHDPGPTPGSAAHWALSSLCQAERIAAFGPAPERATEDFERWTELVTAFAAGALVLAFFDPVPRGYEAFDIWADGGFLDAFPEVLLVAAAFSVDGFEGWLASPWAATWSAVGSQTAEFGGAPRDDFEGWFTSAAPTWTTAMFNAGVSAVEAFEGTWPAMTTL